MPNPKDNLSLPIIGVSNINTMRTVFGVLYCIA